jgi:hypothetical protein
MQIDGHNNRVAGRDYYEQTTLKLTADQLAELSIRPCGRCETRLVAKSKTICNHCLHEMWTEDERSMWQGYIFSVLLMWGGLLAYSKSNLIYVDFKFFVILGVIAMGIVALLSLSWFLIRKYWFERGDEILQTLESWVVRKFK